MSTAPDSGDQADASDDTHRLVGSTVSSNQRYWYEVHHAPEPDTVRLIAVDNVTNRTMTHDELDERLENGWSVVYDGQTGELGVTDDV